MAKLLIWDLDDTLWEGTLAEGDSVVLNEGRANFIRSLNKKGVVSSICSKNDSALAKLKLEEFNLWDEFVFPAIEFSPKGKLVSQIISDMQLRAPDVVFFDDNEMNLREVEFENPGITIIDSRGGGMDRFLAGLDEKLKAVKKSRVEEYRILERKRADRNESDVSNERFLASCGIKVALLRRSDNLPYASRIEELINRTNQLNFTKSRVPPGEIAEYIVDVARNETYGVFVWDNYGYYGLVGFASVEQRKTLRHFLFSCRTMNMGVESAVAATLCKIFPAVEAWPVSTEAPSWIRFVSADSTEFLDLVSRERSAANAEPCIRIMANCQSGAIAHYAGVANVAFDNWPRVYRLQDSLKNGIEGVTPKCLVYGAFNDYDTRHWDVAPDDEQYIVAAKRLVQQAETLGSVLIVILPSFNFTAERAADGVTRERFYRLNSIWKSIAEGSRCIRIVSLEDEYLAGRTVGDPRHFDRDTLMWLGGRVREIFQEDCSHE